MRTLLHNAILNNKAVDITIDNGLIDSVSTPLPLTNEEGDALHEADVERVDRDRSGANGTIDCSGLTVFPGLMNMHSHAPMTLFRGLGDDQPLDVWLKEYIWPAEQGLTDEKVYKGTLQACREMLASGTTAFNDMYFHLPAMAQAVRDSGIRARLGLNIFGDGDELESLHAIMNACGAVPLSIAPHSIYTVSEKGLRRSAEVCQELGLPMHIHMSETQKEVDDCLREHGCRPWEYLDKLGILDQMGNRLIAAHCLHLSEEEIRLIGDHHITCVHCPNSNLKLGSGYRFPMLELLAAGANVMLGTDGSARSNNLDMIEVMKTAALLQKGWRGDPTAVPADMILRLATGGHTVAPGQPACLFLAPVKSVSDLVYATHGESVAMTLVDGKIMYKK